MSINNSVPYYNTKYYNNYYNNPLNTTGATTPIQLTTPTAATPTAETTKSTAKDGKDDGKIGFFGAVGSFFKGAVKSVVNGVKDIVTDPKKLLLAAGCVALSIAFPPAGVALAVAGGIGGAVQVGKGVYNAATATTDAEAEAAFEDMGGGAVQVGLSVAGAKAGLQSCGETTAALAAERGEGITGALAKAQDVGKSFLNDTVDSVKNNGGSFGRNLVKDVGEGEGITGKFKAIGKATKETYEDSTLKTNIDENGVLKGTGKSIQDKYNNLREAGYKKYQNQAETAEEGIQKASGKIKSADAQAVIDEYKNLDMGDAQAVKTFTEKLNKLDASKLSKSEQNAISSFKENFKNLQSANGKIAKLDIKASARVDKGLDDLIAKVDKGEMTQEEALAKLDTLAEEETRGSALTGAQEKFGDWAKQTIDRDAKNSADQYNKYMANKNQKGYSVETDPSKMATNLQKINKNIEKAQANYDKAKAALKEAKDDTAKQAAKNDLASAQSELSKLKTQKGIQENVCDSSKYNNGEGNLLTKAKALDGYILPTAAHNLDTDNDVPAQTAAAPITAAMPQQQTQFTPQQLPNMSFNDQTGMWA